MNAIYTNMNKHLNSDFFNLLRKIDKDPRITQRILAKELGLSLGKLNYCLRALKEKGLIKIKNFNNSKKKAKYFYYLSPKGVVEKTEATFKFMKLKMKEYEELKEELKKN